MLRIRGGSLFDPRHSRRGETGDLCVRDGRIVADLPAGAPEIDATGLCVMPGGIDLHTHVVGSSVGAARLLCPEDGGRLLPTLRETGRRYAAMGYTTLMDAAVAPIAARAAHEDLQQIPIVDKGLYVLLGNNEILLRFLRDRDETGLRDFVAWILEATRAFAVKVANPAGVEGWKRGAAPREEEEHAVALGLGKAAVDLGLPHPIHLHMSGLGQPGNAGVSLRTMDRLRDTPAHFTHLQFHAYGGRTPRGIRSRAGELTAWVNTHPRSTVDVGQVIFGDAVTLSADAPAQHRLHRATGRKWLNLDLEVETGCGIVPHRYREDSLFSSVQWAIGLEILLRVEDPWRVFLTTDHPNGGAFSAYPGLIRLLMDQTARREAIERAHPRLKERSDIALLTREYDLNEIAILTRAGPARALGLDRKGHLGPGADADIVLYERSDDLEAMFARPVVVLKDGVIVAREGTIVEEPPGRTLHVAPPRLEGEARTRFEGSIRDDFERYYTVPFEDYRIEAEMLPRAEAVPARPGRA